MNPIPIIGFSLLGIIALHLAYKFGARKANKKILDELETTNSLLYAIDASVGSFSTIFVQYISDLAAQPKTAKPRKTTRLKN